MIQDKNNSSTQKFDFSKETSMIAYLDLTNMFHWQNVLKWNFSVYDVIKQLLNISSLKEVRVYYGKNERELKKIREFPPTFKRNRRNSYY